MASQLFEMNMFLLDNPIDFRLQKLLNKGIQPIKINTLLNSYSVSSHLLNMKQLVLNSVFRFHFIGNRLNLTNWPSKAIKKRGTAGILKQSKLFFIVPKQISKQNESVATIENNEEKSRTDKKRSKERCHDSVKEKKPYKKLKSKIKVI